MLGFFFGAHTLTPAIFAHFMVSGWLTNTGPKKSSPRGTGRGPGASKAPIAGWGEDGQPGNITVLITWITPFDCMTFPIVIMAVSPLASMSQSLPSFSLRP